MKEFGLTIQEALINGLLPDARMPVNAPYLETLYNLKPSPMGLVKVDVATEPTITTHTPTDDMRILPGHENMIMDYTATKLVMKTLVVTALNSFPSTFTASADLAGEGALEVGEFKCGFNDSDATTILDTEGDTPNAWSSIERDGIWVITNGNALITNCGIFSGWAASLADDTDNGATHDGIIPNSVTMLGDRLILGGIHTEGDTKFDASRWSTMWNAYKTYSGQVGITQESDQAGEEFVMIGLPGGGASDIPFGLELAVLMGHRSSFHNIAVEAAARGEITFARIPWRGVVWGVKTIGDKVMVYGNSGVGIMVRVPSADNNLPGYEIKQLHEVGVYTQAAYYGDEFQQIFIDLRGDVFRVNSDGEITKLGYRNYIDGLTVSELAIAYDAREGDFYITDANKAYLLTPTGLAEGRYVLRSIIPHPSDLYGRVSATGAATANFLTHAFNMKTRQIKLVENIAIEARDVGTITIDTHWRYSSVASYTDPSAAITVNLEGEVFAALQGSDFKLDVTCTPDLTDADPTVSELRIRWKAVDKRYLRGI